ncbi:MAG: MraY family glycosyltransferase [Ardenticatenia bacterium]|nr:MraY family glycosyltransferase [Ardenticatenia bacterium]
MSLFLVPLLVGFGVTVAAVPPTMWLAGRWRLIQHPRRPQDVHVRPVPRAGGVAMVLGFLVAVAVAQWLPVERSDPNEVIRLRGLVVGAVLAAVAGLVDDRRELPPGPQLAVQVGLALVAAWHLIFIERFRNPVDGSLVVVPLWIVVPFTVLWFVGTMNTLNWLDGLDGLAAGVAAIAGTIFALHMLRMQQYSVALLPLALVGSALGFLPYNFNPARVFMGTTGSLFLGYTLAALSIMAGAKVATMLLVLAVPILDVAWQIVARLRRGVSPFQGDRGHLHHRLYDAGYSQRQVVVGYWGVCAFLGALALLLPAPLYKLLALTFFGSLGALVLRVLVPPHVSPPVAQGPATEAEGSEMGTSGSE